MPLDLVLLLGVSGIGGSLTIMFCDWVLCTRPVSTADQSFDTDSVPHWLRGFHSVTGLGVSRTRTFWGSVIGGLAMLPCGLGFVTLYVALRPAGEIAALMASILLGGMMVYGVMAHTLYGVFADLNTLRNATAVGGAERTAVDIFFARLLSFWAWFGLSVIAMQAAGSLLYSFLVFGGETGLPRWMGFVNHFLISQSLMHCRRFLPFTVSRWLAPSHMHLPSTIALLSLTTYFVWEGG